MSDSPAYFLLSIAINEYESTDIPDLDGCLNDAAAIQSCLAEILGPTPASAILCLTNADATRSAIIESDTSTVSGDGHVPGIPDITINALLRILAREKGNNITLICDSCHSGGINRDTSIAPFWTTANVGNGMLGFHGNHSSHILLAACAEEEGACEVRKQGIYYGVFTAALTHALRQLGEDFRYTTYSALVDSLKVPAQHPQCDGQLANCYLFSPRTTPAMSVFRVTPNQSGGFRVAAGEAHGVVKGTEMKIYGDTCARIELGVLVCHEVGPVSSTLRTGTGTMAVIPANSWAGVHRWNTGSLKIHTRAPESINFLDRTSEYRLILAPPHSHAHLTLRSTGPDRPIVVERPGGNRLLAEYAAQCLIPSIPRDISTPAVLSKIAHFHYHLGRQKPPAMQLDSVVVSKMVKLKLYRMAPNSYRVDDKKNLFKKNVAHLDIAETEVAHYSIEILNKTHSGLYAYLFSFDPSNYAIEALHMPPLGATKPCIPAQQSIVVGYGRDSTPFQLRTQCRDAPDAAFFKLFTPAPPPPESDLYSASIPRGRPYANASPDFWDVSVAVVTISKLGFGRRLIQRLL
ncbi:hypothetical protein DFH09DRAFT_1394922 [Mycena vulgaris]|nr:hypothetical protein DFH09DRAFT_1394922 [Mycena vulgaris]